MSHHANQPVVLCNKETGKGIRVFRSRQQAAVFLGLNGKPTNISNVLAQQRKSAYGWGWKYPTPEQAEALRQLDADFCDIDQEAATEMEAQVAEQKKALAERKKPLALASSSITQELDANTAAHFSTAGFADLKPFHGGLNMADTLQKLKEAEFPDAESLAFVSLLKTDITINTHEHALQVYDEHGP